MRPSRSCNRMRSWALSVSTRNNSSRSRHVLSAGPEFWRASCRLCRDESFTDGQFYEFHAIMDIQSLHQPGLVAIEGLCGQEHPCRRFLDAQPRGEMSEHLQLPFTEFRQRRRVPALKSSGDGILFDATGDIRAEYGFA